MSLNEDVFPSVRVSIVCSDPQLSQLLHRVRDRVSEVVQRPWQTMQRAAMPTGGITTPQQLASVLLRFHVWLSMPDAVFLFSSFPQQDGGRFDWPQFVATLFPTALGEQVAPRRRTEAESTQASFYTHPPSALSARSGAVFFGATGATGASQSWPAAASSLPQVDPRRTLPPAPAAAYPVQLLPPRRPVTSERRRLDAAFLSSRTAADVPNAVRTHRAAAPARTTTSRTTSTTLPPNRTATGTLPTQATRSSTRAHASTPPTYMLPVPHRVSAAVRDAASLRPSAPQYAHSVEGRYQPYPDSLRQVNGERITRCKNDAYIVPSIQFGHAIKF